MVFFKGEKRVFIFFPQGISMGKIYYDIEKSEVLKIKLIPNIRIACWRSDSIVMLNQDELMIYGGQSKGSIFAEKIMNNKKAIESVIDDFSKLDENDKVQVLSVMFKAIWEAGKYSKALKVVSNILWTKDIREIICLFPVIRLSNRIEAREFLVGTKPLDNPPTKVFANFGTFLVFTTNEFRSSTIPQLTAQLPILDSSLFQFYAIHHKTRELNELMINPCTLR